MGVVIPKLRQSARGMPCTVVFPSCNHNPETTVLAHLPSPVKGMGNKGDDWHAVFACSNCHYDLDNHIWNDYHTLKAVLRAIQWTQSIWYEMGLMEFPTKEPKPKQSSKIVARPEHFRR